MSARELSRVQVLGRVKAKSLALFDAAVLMGVGYRQAKRLWRRFRRGGAKALRHRSRRPRLESRPARPGPGAVVGTDPKEIQWRRGDAVRPDVNP